MAAKPFYIEQVSSIRLPWLTLSAGQRRLVGLASITVQKISIDLSRERYAEVIKTGVVLERSVAARDRQAGVRVFVLDVPSRRVGSVNVRY